MPDPQNATAAPVENGGFVWKVGGTAAEFDLGDGIPDSDVYLHDDWGDNKLTNRDDSETTTYNGVEGVYRPEWAVDITTGSDPFSANNSQLEVRGPGDEDRRASLRAGINLNLDEMVTWEYTGLDFDLADDTVPEASFQPFSTTTTPVGDFPGCYEQGYTAVLDSSANQIRFYEVTDADNFTELISDSSINNPDTLTITRDASGTWEVYVDGNSIGTATDTTHTAAELTAFGVRSRSDDFQSNYDVDEVKVF